MTTPSVNRESSLGMVGTCSVGDLIEGPFQIMTQGDGLPTTGLAAFVQLIDDVCPYPGAKVAHLVWDEMSVKTETRSHAPTGPDNCRAQGTVTRRRVDSPWTRIHQAVDILDKQGTVRQRSAVQWQASADAGSDLDPRIDDVLTVQWGKLLAQRLAVDPDFESASATFDGSIRLSSVDVGFELRIYRGKILEAARKSLDGPTFTIDSDDRSWIELLTGPNDDYVRMAARGAFTITGNGFQYLRMTRAVRVILDRARSMTSEVTHG